jgi:hypothetical protein
MENLLKPELAVEDSGQSIYSSRALFFTAFIGGPLSLIFLAAKNSRILNRLKTDITIYIAAIIGFIVFLYLVIVVPEGAEGLKWLGEYRRENHVFKYGPRFLALVFWSITCALHRPYHKAMSVMGLEPLRPWGAAILCTTIGAIIQMGVLLGILRIRGVL